MKFLNNFKFSKIKAAVLAIVMMFAFTLLPANFVQALSVSTADKNVTVSDVNSINTRRASISKTSTPTDFNGVAAYIKAYKKLPSNFITKSKARSLGWNASKGNLAQVAPGKSIGGDVFTNREKKLPYKKGRVWRECDIDYVSGFRNNKRILYSNDGLIYKTEDHYNSFTRMY